MNSHDLAVSVKNTTRSTRLNVVPLDPSETYWDAPHVKAGALTFSRSTWMDMVAFMSDQGLALDEHVPTFKPVFRDTEIILVNKLGARRLEALHTMYCVKRAVWPAEYLQKAHLTEGFCRAVVHALDSGLMTRYNKPLAKKLELKRQAIESSGGLIWAHGC
jgi:hypothetical protein